MATSPASSMSEMVIADKQKYLDEYYPFEGVPALSERRRCIHCDRNFLVGEFKVFKGRDGFEYICCPFAPECDGTVIDWFRVE